MNYTNEQIRTIYRSLPSDIKEVIASVEYTDKIQAIGKKYRLMIDKIGALSEETGFVLMGITLSRDFTKNIRERLGVSEDLTINIVKEINEQIFFAVRESLKKIFEKKKEEAEEKKSDTEEIPSREDILREIEDKEHHNLPSTNKTELHLEIPFPSEFVEKSTNFHLEAKLPSEIAPSRQATFQNQKMADEIKREKPAEINLESDKIAKKPFESKEEALRTMPRDIVKAKMGGTVSVPKETVNINDAKIPTKTTQPNTSSKIDPYRERTT